MSAPTPILFLVRSLGVGGAEGQLVNLVNQIKPSEFECWVLTFYPGGHLEAQLKPHIRILSLHKKGRWDQLSFLWRLRAQIKKINARTVYTFLTSANIYGALLKLLGGGFRLVWSSRASSVTVQHYDKIASLELKIQRLLRHLPDLVVCNSDSARLARIEEGFDPRKLVVIENGIDTQRFRPDPANGKAFRTQHRIAESAIVVGLVGRIDPMKDHKTFLRTAAVFLKSHPEAVFACVGEGSKTYEDELRREGHHLGLTQNLKWLGRVDLFSFYNSIDLLALTSTAESFPNVIAEAMSCGKPVVATDVGDARQIVGSFGRIVSSRNPEDMARAWAEVLSRRADWDPQKISASIEQRFSLKQLADKTCTHLHQLH